MGGMKQELTYENIIRLSDDALRRICIAALDCKGEEIKVDRGYLFKQPVPFISAKYFDIDDLLIGIVFHANGFSTTTDTAYIDLQRMVEQIRVEFEAELH